MDLQPITVFFTQNASELIAAVTPTIAVGIGIFKYFGNTPEEEPKSPPEEQTKDE